jgi:hypothetical protein
MTHAVRPPRKFNEWAINASRTALAAVIAMIDDASGRISK